MVSLLYGMTHQTIATPPLALQKPGFSGGAANSHRWCPADDDAVTWRGLSYRYVGGWVLVRSARLPEVCIL